MSLEVVIVAHHAPAGAPKLRPLTELLVEPLVSSYRDRVWRVRLAPGLVAVDTIPPLEAAVDLTSPGTASSSLQLWIDDFYTQWGAAFDLLVIDPSALFGAGLSDAEVQQALSEAIAAAVTDVIPSISYLVDTPQQWLDAQMVPPALNHGRRPVALLGDPPAAGPGGAFLALVDDLGTSLPTLPQLGQAISEFFAGLWKYVQDGGSSAVGTPDVWPVDAARVRLGVDLRTAIGGGATSLGALPAALQGEARRAFERWARAVSGRRIGVALGGGGALSYVGVAFLQTMSEARIPVDVIGGTSFGSVVAGYFASRGDQGSLDLLRHWYWTQWTVLWGWISTDLFQLWIDFDLGFAELNDLEVTFVPVAATATTGHEWYVRSGAIGHACAASGSLPPLAPTYDGDLRLLDGALTAGVPAAIVAAAGSDVVVGVNVVPYPPALPKDPHLPFPRLWNIVRTANPIRRILDFARGYGLLYRQSGHSQDTYVDVVYPADTEGVDGSAFYAADSIVDQALGSQALKDAFDDLQTRWAELVRQPIVGDPGRIRFWWRGDRIFLGGDLEPATPGASVDAIDFAGVAVDPASAVILAAIVALMSDHPWIRVLLRIDSPGALVPDGEARRDSVLAPFLAMGPGRVGHHLRYGAVTLGAEVELWIDPGAPPPSVDELVP